MVALLRGFVERVWSRGFWVALLVCTCSTVVPRMAVFPLFNGDYGRLFPFASMGKSMLTTSNLRVFVAEQLWSNSMAARIYLDKGLVRTGCL